MVCEPSIKIDDTFDFYFIYVLQERTLGDRDRVDSKVWYNEEFKRWEMDPVAVPYAVSHKIIESARIRHDWGAMFVSLKGEDREYYINLKVVSVVHTGLILLFEVQSIKRS